MPLPPFLHPICRKVPTCVCIHIHPVLALVQLPVPRPVPTSLHTWTRSATLPHPILRTIPTWVPPPHIIAHMDQVCHSSHSPSREYPPEFLPHMSVSTWPRPATPPTPRPGDSPVDYTPPHPCPPQCTDRCHRSSSWSWARHHRLLYSCQLSMMTKCLWLELKLSKANVVCM